MTGSPFAVRGVIEGFYGTPWSHEQRLNMIGFIAKRGLNTFVYAPKDDPLMRHEWRTMYSGDELERLSELIHACQRSGIDFMYCLSPGLSIEYSNSNDRDLLVAKFESIAALGVEDFGLLLDDIPTELQHPSDRAVYTDLVTAHIDLANDVAARSRRSGRFILCPTQYCGRGDEDYISRLGRCLDSGIDLFWTGRAICSATLDLADAEIFALATGRPPIYWDNYPVNDVAMTFELHVGPYRGRDPRLAESCEGIIANGMDLFESSKIAFATIADYLASPQTYEPETSWELAIRDIAGADAVSYSLFADNVRSSCLTEYDSPQLQQAIESFTFESSYGNPVGAANGLSALANEMASAANHLLRGKVANPQLIAEARPWISAFELGAHALQKVVELYNSNRLESDGPRVLSPYLIRLRDTRVRVFGDLLDMTLAELTGLGPPSPHNHITTQLTQ